MAEYANGEKPQKVSSGTSTSSSSKVRGVPQSFGYVKRHSAGTSPSPNGVQNGGKDATRTAQVSAVPRTKVSKFHVISHPFHYWSKQTEIVNKNIIYSKNKKLHSIHLNRI